MSNSTNKIILPKYNEEREAISRKEAECRAPVPVLIRNTEENKQNLLNLNKPKPKIVKEKNA